MPNNKKPKSDKAIAALTDPKRLHALKAWTVQHHAHYSEISAHVEFSGETELIAVTQGINHVAIAEFITMVVNIHNHHSKSLLLEAMEALELCLGQDKLTWEAEQAADVVLTRYHRLSKRSG